MKKLKVLLLVCSLTMATMFTGCSFNIGETKSIGSIGTQKFNNENLFEDIDSNDISLNIVSFSQKTSMDKATYTFKFNIENKGDEKATIYFDEFTAFDEDNDTLEDVDFEFDKKVKLDSKEKTDWEIVISGDDASDIEGFYFVYDNDDVKYKIQITDFEEFHYKITSYDAVNEDVVPTQGKNGENGQGTSGSNTTPQGNQGGNTNISTSDVDMSKYRTEWGNDEFGYVTLDSNWKPYKTIDSTVETVQYAKPTSNGSMYIVTLMAGNNTADACIEGIANSDANNPNAFQLGKESIGDLETDGVHFAIYQAIYDEEEYGGTLLTVICTERKNSNYTHYLAYEVNNSNTDALQDEILEYYDGFENILYNYSEMKIIADTYGKSFEDLTASGEDDYSLGGGFHYEGSGEIVAVTTPDPSTTGVDVQVSVSSGTDTYAIFDWDDKKITDIHTPSGYTLDSDFTNINRIAFENKNKGISLWVNCYGRDEDIDYLAGKTYDKDKYGYTNYISITQTYIDKFSTSNGIVYLLKYDKKGDSFETEEYHAILKVDDKTYASVMLDSYSVTESEFISLAKELFQ